MEDSKDLYETITDLAEAQLISSVKKGEPWAIKYWLSTKGKDRGYTTKQEFKNTGQVGMPFQIITTGVMGEDDDREKLKM